MLKIPRIALFKPHESDRASVSAIFSRREYSIRTVTSSSDILSLVTEEDADFDCIMFPPKSELNESFIPQLIQIKTIESLASIPVLGLLSNNDAGPMEALYSAGADFLMLAPWNSEHLYLQVVALCRQRRSFTENLQRQLEVSGLRQSIISAFNSSREGIAICDHEFDLTFVNSAGASLLGIKPSHTLEQVRATVQQFIPLIQKHSSPVGSAESSNTQTSNFHILVSRLDGRSFRAEVRVSTLFGEQRQCVGYSVALSDLSGLIQLSHLLSQAQRTKSLSLILGASCMHLFPGGTIHAPINALERLIEAEQQSASLGDTISYLLELLDVLIPPGIDVRINAKGDWNIAYRPGDIFQLAGLMALMALENASLGGEVHIDVQQSQARQINLVVTSRAESRIRFVQDDLVSQIIEGSVSSAKAEQENRVNPTFAAAQRIATRYRSTVIVERASELEMKLSVALPTTSL